MKIALIGAGGMGTALAALYGARGDRVALWARRESLALAVGANRENPTYLPGLRLPENVLVTGDLSEALTGAELAVFCVPSQAMSDVVKKGAPSLKACLVVSAAKGLEATTLRRMSEIGAAEGVDFVQLSGPCHAEEVGRGQPTASVVGHPEKEVVRRAQEALATPTFRLYATTDRTGVELGGAFKNIIAIASGITEGLAYGDNLRAALLTRGLAEITRLGVALGASPATFAGLSGLGDLMATTMSTHSRNRRAGRALGEGQSLEEVLRSTPMVIEGVPATRAALGLAERVGVEMPLTASLGRILFEGVPPAIEMDQLMHRPLKDEERWDGPGYSNGNGK